MDVLSILGAFLGVLAIVGGNLLEGGQVSNLFNGAAAVIVLGGTVGAAMLQTPLPIFREAMGMAKWMFLPPIPDLAAAIHRVTQWSYVSRREGLLGLERYVDAEQDPFARRGLILLVDGAEPEAIRTVLETGLYASENHALQAAQVYECMGGYAPTMGIIGAVMGLIHVMGNLADPGKLGAGIATAFVATIYGVAVANLILLPIANKLKIRVQHMTQLQELVIEGLTSIAEGENPRAIEMKLQGYVERSSLQGAITRDNMTRDNTTRDSSENTVHDDAL